MADRFPILVLGGTGVFGSRICRRLARDPELRVFVGGRQAAKAECLVAEVQRDLPKADVRVSIVNLPGDLAKALEETRARLVIHTCGPYQGQDYQAPQICIEKGVHYLDLADDRAYVAGFASLDREARKRGVLAVSGASVIPAVSFAVIESLKVGMARLGEVSIGISPGIRSPRGLAVVRAILSYTGKPIPRWQDGAWRQVHGWQDMRRHSLATSRMCGLGRRWFAACDVPDNVLFPAAYPDLKTAAFRAGLELPLLHWSLWLLSWPVRWGLISSLRPYAAVFRRVAIFCGVFGTDRGGMYVDLMGEDEDGRPLRRSWSLVAEAGDGPWVPCMPAVILARKLARDEISARGAMPCLGLVTLNDFIAEIADLRIDTEVT